MPAPRNGGPVFCVACPVMTTTTPESRARIAYIAYGKVTGFKNFRGDPMPEFEDLPETIREAWEAASQVIWDLASTGRASM